MFNKMQDLKFITGNEFKYNEAKKVIPSLKKIDLDLPEIQELDAEVIITEKLSEAAKTHSGSFVVEDISLCFEAWDGLPGPLIKWFLKALGTDGVYKMLEPYQNHLARAVCRVGLMHKGKVTIFKSEVKGKIVSPRGENGFGWDAIFQPQGLKITFAQMLPEEKAKYNMRVDAFTQLKEHLAKLS